ncbi:MAG TPA: hypothetical protein VE974_11025 [Thermoanaerobaculia bacterium]|nr:hypothetical protein [Thermoanaerobaculia bacterium]
MKFLPAAVAFAIAFFAFAFLFLAAPVIPDADSYYHLAVAREYASGGYLEALPWARASVLGETFGDKEYLFHVLLAPFASWTDAASGGRLALALLNAAFVAAITAYATRAFGWWSLAVPLWLYVAAPMMTFRLIRLRPELVALLLLLALLRLASERRFAFVAAVAAVFALSYTAFHVVVGLSFLWFCTVWREREWQLPAAAVAGAAAGLLVHPGFPDNLRIWWIQNVVYFLEKGRLDVGNEIAPPTVSLLLLTNLGWWVGLALLWMGARGLRPDRRRFLFTCIAAGVFALLTVAMQRMAVYFVPLATLAAIVRLEARPVRPRARFALALLATAALSLPASVKIYRDLLPDQRYDQGYEADYTAFGKAVPAGAKVAAHWGPAEFYTFFAPQGRYLNVLDPVFMAVRDPELYEVQRRVFDGTAPDVPGAVKRVLDSDYLAFDVTTPLFERVQFDPRVVPLYNGYTFLGRIDAREMHRFVRDWRGYAFASPFEAYVDAARLSRTRCTRLVREETLAEPVTRIYELAPFGPAELRIGEAIRVRAPGVGAMLGKGTRFRVRLGAGTQRFTVTTCPAAGKNGFYLVRRDG